jgi:hypothetical protein
MRLIVFRVTILLTTFSIPVFAADEEPPERVPSMRLRVHGFVSASLNRVPPTVIGFFSTECAG